MRDEVKEIIDFLNVLAAKDPVGMAKLVETRVSAQPVMQEDIPLVVSEDPEGNLQYGLVGILSGAIQILDPTLRLVVRMTDDSSQVVGFETRQI